MNNQRIIPLLLLCIILLMNPIPTSYQSIFQETDKSTVTLPPIIDGHYISEADGSGDDGVGTIFLSQEIIDQSISVLNSYTNTAHHNGTLDLSSYQIPNWTLYNVTMTLNNLTATIEKEVVGVNPDTYEFKIYEYDSFNGYRYNSLTQGFFDQPYDGLLLNYSFYYETPVYSPAIHNWAIYSILADYHNSSSNLISYTQLPSVGFTATWENATTSSIILDANTEYYVVINGSNLVKSGGFYPEIRWWSDTPSGSFETRRYDTGSSGWISYGTDALLNYSYIPWNRTSNDAMVFANPEDIQLRGNASSLTGKSISWVSSNNITSIQFDSNQSAVLNYNLTLWYKKEIQVNSLWDIPISGGNVDWNLTFSIEYPELSGSISHYANLTKMPDWSANGLYKDSSYNNYDNFTVIQDTILCSNLTNGTWTMTFTAHNYVSNIVSLQSVSILSDLTITSLIMDGSSFNASTGSTNLTIWQENTRVDTIAVNETVDNGATQVVWDINSDTSNNGLFRIEVFWENGTEAGYLTKEFVVYYPTDLTATSYSIQAYTEDSFEIRVYFSDTFNDQGLTTGLGALVELCYDGGTNQSMTDLNNGTWTAIIPTTGNTSGNHLVEVYAKGFAIENQTLSIPVVLTHNTLPLVAFWSQPYQDTITFDQETNLTILYQRIDGTNITDATLNVTLSLGTFDLHYDPVGEFYWIQFNGSDFISGLGSFTMTIEAWKTGYVEQFNNTLSLTVNEIPTNPLSIVWEPYNVTISYTSSLNLTVDYTYSGGDVPTTDAIVNVTINGVTYPLTYSGGSWYVSIPGESIGVGVYSAVINAWNYGYEQQTNITSGVNITLAPNSFVVEWEPSDYDITYVEWVHINVIYTYDYTPLVPATVQLHINGTRTYDLTFNATTGKYHISLNGSIIGLGWWNFTVTANKIGYDSGIVTQFISVDIDTCSASPNWNNGQLYYTHTLDLNVTLLNSLGQPITTAMVNVTYQGQNYTMQHIGSGVYRLVFNGTDGYGTYPIVVRTFAYGFTNETLNLNLQIDYTPTSYSITTLIGSYSSSTVYYDGWIRYSIQLQDIDLNPLTMATVNLTISGNTYTMTSLGNGTYSLNLTASDYAIGTYTVTIIPSLIGYEFSVLPIQLEIFEIPTRLDYTTVPTIMFINDTVLIDVGYVNEHTGQRITPSTIQFTWAGQPLLYETLSPGQYRLNISSYDLSLMLYVLDISFELDNYSQASQQFDITIRAVYTTFTSQYSYSQYENETITLTTIYYDVDHNHPIYAAIVTATIGSNEYSMNHIGNGQYTVVLFLDMLPNSYTVLFTASANGCADNSTTATITVLAKTLYTLTIDAGNPVAGSTLGVTVTVEQEGNPIGGITVTVYALVQLKNDTALLLMESGTTTTEGITQVNFDISDIAINLTIWAEFAGSISEWKVVTDSVAYSVTPAGGLLETLVAFIRTPLGIIITSLIAVSIVAIITNIKITTPRREKRQISRMEQYRKFELLQSLKHFMAVYLNRGTCVFYHPFTEERIEPDLISGFLSAITSVYGEISGDGLRGTLEAIQYKGLYLNSYSGKYIIGILIMEREMSSELKKNLESFVEMFEIQYDKDLTKWTGVVDCFDPEWVITTLYELLEYDLLVPHILLPSMRIRGVQKKVVDIIGSNLNEQKEFYLRNVIPSITSNLHISDENALDILLKLRDLGYILPLSTQNILLRQGMGIVNGGEKIREINESSVESDAKTITSKIEDNAHDNDVVVDADESDEVRTKKVSEKIKSPEDRFLVEVETKLKETKSEKTEDESAEEFVKEVESLLSKEKKEDDEA